MAQQWTSYRARFQGKLEGIKTSQLLGLDYNLEYLKDRIEFIEGKLDETMPFFNEYFFTKEEDKYDNCDFNDLIQNERLYFNYSPNTTDELSGDINICKYIELYANYILNSKDLPKERQQQYKILSEDRFKKIIQREKNMSEIGADDPELEGLSIDQIILDTRPTNDYNNLDLRITSKDLDVGKQTNAYGVREKDLYLQNVLNGYMQLQNFLKTEMDKIRNGETSEYKLYELIKIMSEIKKDMLLAKRQILGIRCQAKRLGDENPTNDFSKLDYRNPEHIKYALKFCRITNTPRPDDMISHIGYDLRIAIDKLKMQNKLDNIDLEIIDCHNSGRYTIRDIAKEIKRAPNVVTQRIDKISKRISKII